MIPIYKPFMPENITTGINEILYSGQLAYGKYGKEFEKMLSQFIGNPHILTTTTYNHALLTVLSVLDLKPGDEIIASPVSCLASNQPFAIKSLNIRWIDVDPETSAMDVSQLRSLITKNTKAIFNNLFCGYAGELEDVYQIGKEFGIPVIDDCIEAFGTEYKGNRTGNTGADMTVFSFQTVRLPNTIDGGAISFNNKVFFEKAKLVRDYGIDRTNFRLENGEINPDCDINIEGYGATMSEINSYIGLKQIEEIETLLGKQKANAEKWNTFFEKQVNAKPLKINKNVNPNFWVYGVLSENKNEFLQKMKDKGFYSTGVHINNNIYSVFKNRENLKGVNEFMGKYVAVPCGWWL
ncbi:DegT/DnrJ/EryC1/StrS family aminotransferase [Chryseobacterium populi]|uniref:Putative PLP-dependent enzyme possibly involved in cell wall biogenesis n=1 Tax=Chryseobacterium populi TaxID=1144316 RepID=J2KPB4_9FLAO|nr:DegT/DnrJ/EryC1/StrS family aminotransferase [Chryseobacterium populi]EJL74918.1 putative PLP-dependent enzyme possibly involved in cell wall biogenesis [Chryseobacterium populi]